jgi:hypothetical protein
MSTTTRNRVQVRTVLVPAVVAAVLAAGPASAAVPSQSAPAVTTASSVSHCVTLYAAADVGVESPVGGATDDSDWPGN